MVPRTMLSGEQQQQLSAPEAWVLPASRKGSVSEGRSRRIPTIQDIPVELLLEIFHILVALYNRARTPWGAILLVCRDWYKVAHDASELWRVIHVRSNTDWLRLCLQRSARSPVDLHLSGRHAATFEAAIPLVIPHAQRIRAIHLTGAGLLSQTEKIRLFLAHPLPALEELSVLSSEWGPGRSRREAPLIPWTQIYHGLRSLALSGVSMPRDPVFYRNLRVLELHEGCCAMNKVTIDDLVLALHAAASTLEELDLSRFAPFIPAHAQSPPPQLPNVRFKRLRGFRMDGEFPVVARLNEHLTLPRDASLHLRVFLPYADQLRYANSTEVLAGIVPPPGVRHVLEGITDMEVAMSLEMYLIRASIGPIVRAIVDTRGWWRDRCPGLLEILTVPSPGLLTSLSITLSGFNHTTEEWTMLFRALRLLERLTIIYYAGYVSPIRAFVALSAPTDPGSADVGCAASSDTVLCPSLGSLHLQGTVSTFEMKEFFDALGCAVRSRLAFNHRFEELLVAPRCSSSAHVTRSVMEVQLAGLEPLVGVLTLL